MKDYSNKEAKVMRKVSVLMLLISLMLLSVPGLGNTAPTKTRQTRKKVSKKLDVRATPKPAQALSNTEVLQAQVFLDEGVARLAESLECFV